MNGSPFGWLLVWLLTLTVFVVALTALAGQLHQFL